MGKYMGKIENINIQLLCFNEEHTFYYGLSEYGNRVYEYDTETKRTNLLVKLDVTSFRNEWFRMVYCCGKLLLIPRLFGDLLIVDVDTKEIVHKDLKALHLEKYYGNIGFFHFVYGEEVYLFCRVPAEVFILNIKTMNIKKESWLSYFDSHEIETPSFTRKEMSFLSRKDGNLYIIDFEKKKFDMLETTEVNSALLCGGCTEKYMYIYKREENLLYKISKNKQVTCTLDVAHYGICTFLLGIGSKLYLFLENQKILCLEDADSKIYSFEWKENIQRKLIDWELGGLVFKELEHTEENLLVNARYIHIDDSNKQEEIGFPIPYNQSVEMFSQIIIDDIREECCINGLSEKNLCLESYICLVDKKEQEERVENVGNKIFQSIIVKGL